MRIDQYKPEFNPIKLILESKEDVLVLISIFEFYARNASNPKHYDVANDLSNELNSLLNK